MGLEWGGYSGLQIVHDAAKTRGGGRARGAWAGRRVWARVREGKQQNVAGEPL